MEITLVIGLILGMLAIGITSTGWFARMHDAKSAEATLRLLENARISWLMENPSKTVEDVSIEALMPFMADTTCISELKLLGYNVSDADLKKETIHYSMRDRDALPIQGFPLN